MTVREARTTVIDGRRVLVVDRDPPIPATLEILLQGGRDARSRRWSPIRLVNRYPLRISGARAECSLQSHRLTVWLEGFHLGSDGHSRFLSLHACADCGAVCVRDQSVDTSAGRFAAGGRPLRRMDHILGWYSGARPRNRVYA
jgi:hypothetical protein